MEEVRIVVTAKDQVSDALKPVQAELSGIGKGAEDAAGQALTLTEAGRLMGQGMQLAGVQGAGGIRILTGALATLEVMTGPVLIIIGLIAAAASALIVEVKVLSAGLGFLGESFRQALGDQSTKATGKLHASIDGLGVAVAGLKSWVGNALIGVFGPALSKIYDFFVKLILSIPQFIQNVINNIINFFNKAGSLLVSWVNRVIEEINIRIRFLNAIRSAFGGEPMKLIAKLSWTNISFVNMPSIAGPSTNKTISDLGPSISVGSGSGGSSSGDGGSSIGGVSASFVNPKALAVTRAINASEVAAQLAIQELTPIGEDELRELIAMLRSLPTAVREAVVVHASGRV